VGGRKGKGGTTFYSKERPIGQPILGGGDDLRKLNSATLKRRREERIRIVAGKKRITEVLFYRGRGKRKRGGEGFCNTVKRKSKKGVFGGLHKRRGGGGEEKKMTSTVLRKKKRKERKKGGVITFGQWGGLLKGRG